MNIGSLSINPPTFLAPMAAVSDLPFRRLCREYGVGLVTTELVSINGLVLGKGKSLERTRSLLRTHPSERPRGVQLFGADPELVAEAAQIAVEEGADLIDFNMGCPVPKICKTGAGAALLRDPIHAARLINAAAKAVKVPVTAKIRAGWSHEGPSGVEISQRLIDAGAQAIAIHARTRSQGFSGNANWRLIEEIKSKVNVPVIGNGDIFSPQDAVLMQQETGCDGVMLGRGAMGLPMIFRELRAALEGKPFQWPPSIAERHQAFLRHIELTSLHFGKNFPLEMRKQLLHYTRGLEKTAWLRTQLPFLKSAKDYIKVARQAFQQDNQEALLAPPQVVGGLG